MTRTLPTWTSVLRSTWVAPVAVALVLYAGVDSLMEAVRDPLWALLAHVGNWFTFTAGIDISPLTVPSRFWSMVVTSGVTGFFIILVGLFIGLHFYAPHQK